MRNDASRRDTTQEKMAEVRGNRRIDRNTGKTVVADQSGAESGAFGAESAPIDSDLQAIIGRWPDLPQRVKASIAAMVATGDE